MNSSLLSHYPGRKMRFILELFIFPIINSELYLSYRGHSIYVSETYSIKINYNNNIPYHSRLRIEYPNHSPLSMNQYLKAITLVFPVIS